MKKSSVKTFLLAAVAGLALWGLAAASQAQMGMGMGIEGIEGPHFNLTAKDGYINSPEGGIIYTWGYADGAGPMQYPGPTLKVMAGQKVTIKLKSELSVPVSIVFPGQLKVRAKGGKLGKLTRHVPAGNVKKTVIYTFVANEPGTYIYHSGTDMQLQLEMGLVGALIVYPMNMSQAYDDPATSFDHETLFLETEMDPIIHEMVEVGMIDLIDFRYYMPVLWFLNGRAAPDTMAENFTPWQPHQPYNCMPMMAAGETMLLRVINAGRDLHPFHTHGNFFSVIGMDGRMLESAPGMGADLAYKDFTITVPPGGTADALFSWTGAKLGWDVYGHAPGDSVVPGEYLPDHGKPFPVILPDPKATVAGPFYSGSPFLGMTGVLPPGSCGMNPAGAFIFMWHSHKEKEMTNNDVFPGGMMTMLMVTHPMTPMGAMILGQQCP